MKLRLLLLLLLAFGVMPLFAQSNKLIRELEQRHSELQKQIAEQESLLTTTKKDVGSQLNGLATLTGQIKERKKYIDIPLSPKKFIGSFTISQAYPIELYFVLVINCDLASENLEEVVVRSTIKSRERIVGCGRSIIRHIQQLVYIIIVTRGVNCRCLIYQAAR